MKATKIALITGMVIMALGGIGGVMLAGYTIILHGG
ncbi:protein YohO [Apirhabdus apintestini]|nr:protein YohO [Erwinia sp. HR93]MEA1065461.1 protein YohO [Erwinia sp. HR93]WPM85564.1 protein YohO [Enterobacteriaceae bacterium CA-0114]